MFKHWRIIFTFNRSLLLGEITMVKFVTVYFLQPRRSSICLLRSIPYYYCAFFCIPTVYGFSSIKSVAIVKGTQQKYSPITTVFTQSYQNYNAIERKQISFKQT